MPLHTFNISLLYFWFNCKHLYTFFMLIINLNQNKSDLNYYISGTLLENIEKNLKQNKKTILYLNKRGSFSSLICEDCQYYYKCKNCDVSLTVHENTWKIACHLCWASWNTPLSCSKCNWNHLKKIWVWTQQIEDSLRNYFKPSPQPSPLEEREQKYSLRKLELKSPWYIFILAKKFRKNLTKSEKRLWEIIRDKKFNNLKFRRQHPIWRYIADFYVEELKLVLELDWGIHEEINRKEYDLERDNLLRNYWFNIIRIKNQEILNNTTNEINNILSEKILPLLQRRGLGWGQKTGPKIFRFDLDSIKNKTEKIKALDNLENADIVIATKMITTGFDFKNIWLIWIILTEQEFSFPNYNTEEKAYINIKQLIWRWNRLWEKTEIICQTFIPDNEIIKNLSEKNYKTFFIDTLSERKLFNYPPFTELVTLEYRDKSEKKSLDFMLNLKNKLNLLNPSSSKEARWRPIEIILNKQSFKKNNQYFTKIILKWDNLRKFLENIKYEIYKNSNLTIIFE